MILIDSSVWIDHIRAADARVADFLARDLVLLHPFVIGEIALGSIRNRDTVLRMLRRLPASAVARDHEVASLIERERLFGSGIGYVDAHLLASARLTSGALLWTRDKRLQEAAVRLSVAAKTVH